MNIMGNVKSKKIVPKINNQRCNYIYNYSIQEETVREWRKRAERDELMEIINN